MQKFPIEKINLFYSESTMHSSQHIANTRGSAERYRTLLEINNAIITNLTQESLLTAICEVLQRFLPVYRAAVTLLDRSTDSLRIYALSKEWTTDYFQVGLEVRKNDSHSGWVLEHQKPLVRRDLETEWEFPVERRLLQEGVQSYCAVPLKLGTTIIGTLNVGSDAKDRYSSADVELLTEVSSQVALAVANMQSYQQIAALSTDIERTAERYRTLLEINNAIVTNLNQEDLPGAICKALRRVLAFDRAAFTLYVPEKDTFRFLGIEGPVVSTHFRAGLEFRRDESISAWVFDHQRPALCHNLQGGTKISK